MKVFLWRPTWAHFHLELLWQFAIEDRILVGLRIWVEILNYHRFQERWPWVQLPGRLVFSGPTLTHCPSQSPIIFNFHATLNEIWTSTLFFSEQVHDRSRRTSFLGSDPRSLSHRLRWKSASLVDPPKTSRERQTDKKHFSLEENSLNWIRKIVQKFPADFIFHSWELNCTKTGNFYREFCE